MTVGRIFSDTFAGIDPSSVPGFIAAQLVGGLLGVALVRYLFPDVGSTADDVVVPHPHPTHDTPDEPTQETENEEE